MKRKVVAALLAAVMMSGCAGTSALISKPSTSTRSDVFQEASLATPVEAGYAHVRVTSSLKTHRPGIYSAKDIHGTADYKLLLNIDGQVLPLQGVLREEKSEAHRSRYPEGGEGIRYTFTTNLRLRAGAHKVVIAAPADDIAVEREITFREGSNLLDIEPVYRANKGKPRIGFYGTKNFQEGIKTFEIILNGNAL